MFDYNEREPYLQISLDTDENDPDLKDEMLKHFIEQANQRDLIIIYPTHGGDNTNTNSFPQIRLGRRGQEVSLENNASQ